MQEDFQKFQETLKQMGINPGNTGIVGESTLPPLPPADPGSLARNHYDGFYKRASRELWAEADITQNKVEEFKKCQHYLMKIQNEIRCKLCNVGWVVPESFHTQDGKLYDSDTPLVFSV